MATLVAIQPINVTSFPRDGNDHAVVMVTAPANQRLKVVRCKISYVGPVATDPQTVVKYGYFSGIGSGGSGGTPGKENPSLPETIQGTTLLGKWSTTEPPVSSTVGEYGLYPLGTMAEAFTGFQVPGGGHFGIVVNAGSTGTAITVVGELVWEE